MRRMYSEKQIEELIKQVVSSGLIENAKPLYFHPVVITDTANDDVISFTILNNDSTPFTTLAQFINYVMAWGDGAQLICNGGNLRTLNSGSSFTPSCVEVKENELYFVGMDNGGVYHSSTQYGIKLNTTNFTAISDKVNKIN